MIEPMTLHLGEAPGPLAAAAAPPFPAEDGYDPDAIFELIERTAETIRSLRKSEASVAAREQTFKAQLERDRAIWRDDLDELRRTVEACLEKTAIAERDATECRTQAKRAIELLDASRIREAAAIRRADAAEARARLAEERYARLEAFLSKSFSTVLARRTAG